MEHTSIPKEELEVFKQLKDLKVIFDVGARTDIDYLEIWPESEHYLFEPNPLFVVQLWEKIKDKTNVYLNKYALGDKEEIIGYQIGLESIVGSEAIPRVLAYDILISVKTLDWYVKEKNIKQIDFFKIDTEGYDLKVLLGAKESFGIIKFIQYEHWGYDNNSKIYNLLQDDFETEYIGYRNTLCINKNLVDEEEKKQLKDFIKVNEFAKLV